MSNSRRTFLQSIGSVIGLATLSLLPTNSAKSATNSLARGATLTTIIHFPPNKKHNEIIADLKTCTDSNMIESIFSEFFNNGKMVEQSFRKHNDHLEYKIVFNNHDSLNEYMSLMTQRKVVDVPKQSSIGYQATSKII